MSPLDLQLEDPSGVRTPFRHHVTRLVAAGFAGRDQAAALAHIRELEAHGIATPARIPTLYHLPRQILTTGTEVEVLGGTTSGEVEAVLFVAQGGIYVGVGSDHTDRELEKAGIATSKAICPKVLGDTLWPLDQVRDHWDRLTLRSWVEVGGRMELYQDGLLAELLPPERLLDEVAGALGGRDFEGLVLFGGTIATRGGKFVPSPRFQGSLGDPVTGRSLHVAYTVDALGALSS